MHKILKCLPLVASTVDLSTFLGVEAEEKSILHDASLSQDELIKKYTWNELGLIDGNFKSLYCSDDSNKKDG